MAGSTKVTVIVKLKYGPQARFSFHVPSTVVAPDDAIITGLIAVLEAITRGKAIHIEISLSASIAGSPVSGAAYVSEDKGLFRFSDANGVSHAYKVGGILSTVVATNKEDLLTGVTPGSTYVAAVIANAKTRSNDAITTYVAGHRTENRKPIKAGTI